MVNYGAKKHALAAFAKQLLKPENQEAIIAAYMADTSFTRKNILQKEVNLPATILQDFGKENNFTQAFNINPLERQPIGTVAILWPKNGVGQVANKSVFCSFLWAIKRLSKCQGNCPDCLRFLKN